LGYKFLLAAVNAKYIHSNPAIYSLRACAGETLRRYVDTVEYTINQPMQEILADLYHRKPDAIGFSCYIWNWRLIQELLAEVPKLLPETALWLGGPEVSYDAEAVLRQYPWLDGIMVGEGEDTFRELLGVCVEKYELSRNFETISQPVHRMALPESREERMPESKSREGGSMPPGTQAEVMCPPGSRAEKIMPRAGIRCAQEELAAVKGLCLPLGATPRRELADMDRIPFLYDDLTPFENKIIYYESSRGCPFRCSYCLSSIDKAVRFRDIHLVERELQYFLDHKVKQVKFVDRTFNCSHDHAMAIWQYIYEHDNGVTNFHFEISADLLREDEIALLRRFRPGLAQLEIGVQSANPETLRAIRRVTDLEKLERAVSAIRSGGNIHQHLDLIAGLPYEDYESFGASFDRVYRMRPDQIQLGFLKVLKGSELCDRAQEYGIRYLSHPPYEVLSTRWLPYEDVLRLKQVEEMVELYYNSAQFTHTLPFLEKAFSGPFAMYKALADFYRRKGCALSGSARAYRYQVLCAFAAEQDGERLEVYRELLTYDMYLREKPKSRPEFAAELSGWKDAVRAFYREEEQSRRFLPDYAAYDAKQLERMTHLEPFFYPVWDVEEMAAGYEAYGCGTAGKGRNESGCAEAGSRRGESGCAEAGSGQGESGCAEAESGRDESGCAETGTGQGESGCAEAGSRRGESGCAEAGSGQGESGCAEYGTACVRHGDGRGKLPCAGFVLFDYRKRSPLNYEAAATVVMPGWTERK